MSQTLSWVCKGMKPRLEEHPFEDEIEAPERGNAIQAECSRRATNQPSQKHGGRGGGGVVTWGRGYNDQKINSKRKAEAKWKRLDNLQKVTLTMRHATFLALPAGSLSQGVYFLCYSSITSS